jgi:hypothetical protein
MAAGAIRLENHLATRTAFSQGFIRDLALVCEEGLDAVRKVEAFV